MFYCEECKIVNNYPGIITMSHGRCEICGETKDCYDIKSSDIKKKDENDGIYGRCSVCSNIIWAFMEKNKEYLDQFDMCGSCVTGESAEYISELPLT